MDGGLKKQILATPASLPWQQVGIAPHHGIDLFLPALRSEKSAGCGEILDLLPLIDWCSSLGFDLIQLLPLFDMGHETSPYNALSSCAIDPLFISLYALPWLDGAPDLIESLTQLKRHLIPSSTPFRELREEKKEWLVAYVTRIARSHLSPDLLKQFMSDNPWLLPYALFKTLKETHQHNHWCNWPEEHRNLPPESMQALYDTLHPAPEFFVILQYLASEQLKEVRRHAESRGLLIKGDLPILVSPDSADVWAEPHLFNPELAVGAPPDFYVPEGQCWGFPVPLWEEHPDGMLLWWQRRLSFASHLFHLYRIDHIIGFFHLWAVPNGKKAKDGFFLPREEALWLPRGKEIIEKLLISSLMLPIAEDLGTVPTGMREELTALGICGTKVMRWEREEALPRHFIPPSHYQPLSMTTLSTHDSPTLALWWRDFTSEASLYAQEQGWDYEPTLSTEQRMALLKASHHSASLFHVNLLQEYLALFSELVWEELEQERINIPGYVLPRNWSYRYRPSLETIINHEGLASAIKSLLP